MNVTLWILQVLLAAVFLAHGVFLLAPPASMIELLNASMSPAFRIFLGVAEAAAAIGLTLPGVVRVLPGLIPAAAVGVMVVMISATIFHVARGELLSASITAILLAMAGVVAYLRWRVHAIRGERELEEDSPGQREHAAASVGEFEGPQPSSRKSFAPGQN